MVEIVLAHQSQQLEDGLAHKRSDHVHTQILQQLTDIGPGQLHGLAQHREVHGQRAGDGVGHGLGGGVLDSVEGLIDRCQQIFVRAAVAGGAQGGAQKRVRVAEARLDQGPRVLASSHGRDVAARQPLRHGQVCRGCGQKLHLGPAARGFIRRTGERASQDFASGSAFGQKRGGLGRSRLPTQGRSEEGLEVGEVGWGKHLGSSHQ